MDGGFLTRLRGFGASGNLAEMARTMAENEEVLRERAEKEGDEDLIKRLDAWVRLGRWLQTGQ